MAERSQGLGSPDAHWQMTVALAALGRFERAEREFDTICPANQAQTPPCMGLRIVLLVATKHASEAKTLFEKLTASNGAELPGFYSYRAGAYANDFIDIPRATLNARMSLRGDSTDVLTPLRWVVGQAPRLPEEISTDPEWLAFWDDPKLRDLMTAYRANILAFRQGK